MKKELNKTFEKPNTKYKRALSVFLSATKISVAGIALVSSVLWTSGCSKKSDSGMPSIPVADGGAPGAPGKAPVWAFSGKTGIGTSYEAYPFQTEINTGENAKVWFSIANGVLTETMFGMIHEAQLQRAELVIVGPDFVDIESSDTHSTIDYLYKDANGVPISLAYKIVNKDKEGKYEIEKHIFTNPDNQSLYHRVIVRSNIEGVNAYFYANPHVANTGSNDKAWVEDQQFYISEGETVMAIAASQPWQAQTVGFVGESDGLAQLMKDKKLSTLYHTTGEQVGNVALVGALPPLQKQEDQFVSQTDIVLAFGSTQKDSQKISQQTLKQGYQKVLDSYNGVGDAVGWEDYLSSLSGLAALKKHTNDGGKLLSISALVLKAQEDKTHHGALIASLSTPWGDTVSAEESATGYKAVWPRDFYQCAMALLALGDTVTPKVAFEYLEKVQVTKDTPKNKGDGGWFLQKTHVDGTLEWVGVQLDQTAMPIMLGWKLWRAGVLSDEEAKQWYSKMLKPAADFLVTGGNIDIDWNKTEVRPPYTQQERWEEQAGYSPSSMAAVIAALVVAADFAGHAGDRDSAGTYTETADQYRSDLLALTFTDKGLLNTEPSNGKYFLRINDNKNPNDQGTLVDRNGQGPLNESKVVDAGFLELVRYGVFYADQEAILESLDEIDDQTLPDQWRVHYSFPTQNGASFSGWRRYGGDGYGEDSKTGQNYGEKDWEMTPDQRGRVWPFLTGERGHHALALAMSKTGELGHGDYYKIKHQYVGAMEHFANEGYMLPEQVWDGVGHPTKYNFKIGDGTNSATPLAWAHAEYVKLLKSIADEKIWDSYDQVIYRYDH